jgi:hypothetical protein
MRYSKTIFDDLDAAFEEMEYLVGQTELSHRIVRRKDGRYRVIPFRNKEDQKGTICELNIRNIVGERFIHIRRGTKSQRRHSGKKGAVSGLQGAGSILD